MIRPALDRGSMFCATATTMQQAYQGFARGVPQDLIDHLAELLQILTPDLTLSLKWT